MGSRIGWPLGDPQVACIMAGRTVQLLVLFCQARPGWQSSGSTVLLGDRGPLQAVLCLARRCGVLAVILGGMLVHCRQLRLPQIRSAAIVRLRAGRV